MSYFYFEHEADVGIAGRGKTLAEAFQEAAKAMFNLMVDIQKVKPASSFKISCEAANDEELFVEWLNALLAEADIQSAVFCEFEVAIRNNKLSGTAKGEKLNPEKHSVKTEVKAATYSQLRIEKKNGEFIARCVVDV